MYKYIVDALKKQNGGGFKSLYPVLVSLLLQITIPFKSVRAITKEKTVLVIPNAIQITVSNDKYGFTSLVNRDVTYTIIFKCWQNNLLDQVRWRWGGLGQITQKSTWVPINQAKHKLVRVKAYLIQRKIFTFLCATNNCIGFLVTE